MNAFQKLENKIKEKDSPLCVGLDPHLDLLPEEIVKTSFDKYGKNAKGAATAILEFNLEIIEAIRDLVPAVKPQIAFYEKWGSEGILALEETVAYAKKRGLMVIMDAKRNDIGSTARAYAEAFLSSESELSSDFLTVTPYLGTEGITPFLELARKEGKGVFLVAFTSNEMANEIQGPIKDVLIKNINTLQKEFGNLGAVLGLTRDDFLEIQAEMPNVFYLIPGLGAQGGSVENFKELIRKKGKGIVSASRSVLFAFREGQEKDFKKAATEEVKRILQSLKA